MNWNFLFSLDLDEDLHEGEPSKYVSETEDEQPGWTEDVAGEEMDLSDEGLGQGSNQTGKTIEIK